MIIPGYYSRKYGNLLLLHGGNMYPVAHKAATNVKPNTGYPHTRICQVALTIHKNTYITGQHMTRTHPPPLHILRLTSKHFNQKTDLCKFIIKFPTQSASFFRNFPTYVKAKGSSYNNFYKNKKKRHLPK